MNIPKEKKLELYRSLLLIRKFEEKVRECFLAGMIPGFIHSYLGEEAVATGTCANLDNEDKICSHHRGTGHALAKGCDPKRIMAELFGKQDGLNGGRVGQMHMTDVAHGLVASNGIVGGALPLAVGAAFYCKHQQKKKVTVAFCGDGGSNRGTSHEGVLLAAIWKLPLIVVIENNQIAGTNRFDEFYPIDNIAERASGYGIPGMIVDGNDVEAVYEVVGEAVKRARNGDGPSIIECKTWRTDGHYIGDPGWSKLPGENEEWMEKRDPIKNYAAKLLAGGFVTQSELDKIEAETIEIVEKSVKFAENNPWPTEAALTSNVYAS
jgi:pyruvate dehydrogenase E1 component alpha subunit